MNERDIAETHFFAGVRCLDADDLAGAEAAFRRAVAANPDMVGAWCNLGITLAMGKREAEAETCYRHALALAPDYRNAAFNLAYLLLRQGRYEEGWARLEARDWYDKMSALIPACPRWRGEPLAGKRIFVGIEAGHGDMIQLCRYVLLLKTRGAAHVAVFCHPGLKRLFGTLAGVDSVIALNEALPSHAFDFWVPPFSLPFLFGTRLDSIPAQLPYLSVPAELRDRWASVVPATPELCVGLAWRGNPKFENDADRSLPSIDVLKPLAAILGVRFVSLQKDATDIARASFAIDDPMERVEDFADTAAIVTHLDLVISVDTAVAHLAGAMGRLCWLLLPDYRTDWRWLADREDSPWYPGVMRLFRQPKRGDWDAVIAAVTDALRIHSAAWLSNPPSSRSP